MQIDFLYSSDRRQPTISNEKAIILEKCERVRSLAESLLSAAGELADHAVWVSGRISEAVDCDDVERLAGVLEDSAGAATFSESVGNCSGAVVDAVNDLLEAARGFNADEQE